MRESDRDSKAAHGHQVALQAAEAALHSPKLSDEQRDELRRTVDVLAVPDATP